MPVIWGFDPRKWAWRPQRIISGMKDNKIKAALIMADGLSGHSAALEGLTSGLEQLEFLAVSAVFDSEITAHADVVLPAATYPEQTSTVTNLERRVKLLRITAEPREEVRTGWETICLMLRQWVGLDSITLLHLKYFPRFQVPSQITLIYRILNYNRVGYSGHR
ncbi:MAG: hypothetical protein Ct9H300mP19_16490 [Dehalococcoidia bacterium]|nr:MAG: hypothetical protein Ct9H300mP19_16490 [Dehalococcoidia bacterium]